MRVLYVDDEQYRHDGFVKRLFGPAHMSEWVENKSAYVTYHVGGYVVYHVYNAQQAIRQLKARKFDAVSLDHDLGGDRDGMDVVDYMCQALPEDHRPNEVVIHSMNLSRACEMEARLLDAGFKNVVREQFSWR